MAIVANKAGTDAGPQAKDTPYSSPNRTAATAVAVMALTPQYSGECVVALDTGNTFMATGNSGANQWQQMYPRT